MFTICVVVGSFLPFLVCGRHITGQVTLDPEDAVRLLQNGTQSRRYQSSCAPRTSSVLDYGGGYGDLCCNERQYSDYQLVNELIMVEEVTSCDSYVKWYASLDAETITSVRIVNVGRDRGYCEQVNYSRGEVLVIVKVAAYTYPVMFIEIYGY
jgi:hypothetical protein